MLQENAKSTQKGEAFERLLLATVAHSPIRPRRADIIDSKFLAAAHRNEDSSPLLSDGDLAHDTFDLSNSEKRNAAKALGRMVGSDALREVIALNGLDERVNLPESGLIAVSISLPVLNAEHEMWVDSGQKGAEPTQEVIADTIRNRTIKWIVENNNEAGIPLFLQDIWIVHGSNSFDMLILVMYRNSREFMMYVREVVQRVKGILGTQTMQISNNLASNHQQFEVE